VPQSLPRLLVLPDERTIRTRLIRSATDRQQFGQDGVESFCGTTGSTWVPTRSEGISDWDGMGQAFSDNLIDIAFYIGPLGSDAGVTSANDGTAALIGVGGIGDALRLAENYAVVPAAPAGQSR